MEKSKRFEELNEKYQQGYCSKEQLREYAELEVITLEEYTEITGDTE